MYDIQKLYDAYDEAKASYHVSKGNSKLGKIPSFNLLPVVTCTEECMKEHGCGVTGCYAVKNALCHGYDIRKNDCLKAWAENTKLIAEHLDLFETLMNATLDRYKGKLFRIHSSGDFCSVKYARAWERIIKNHPNIKFLAFTKAWKIVRKTNLDKLPNLSLLASEWDGMPIPQDIAERLYCSYVVRKGEYPPENAIKCAGSCEKCHICWFIKDLGKNVWFAKH